MSDTRTEPEPPERRPSVVMRGDAAAHALEANRLSADATGMSERHALISIAASLAEITDHLAAIRAQGEPTT